MRLRTATLAVWAALTVGGFILLSPSPAHSQVVTCPIIGEICLETGQACSGVSHSWPQGCGCSNNSLFYRHCGQSYGGCDETPPGTSPDDYCGVTCAYYFDDPPILCPGEIEPPCVTCALEAAAGSAPPGKPRPRFGSPLVAHPVSVTTGEMFFTHADAQVGELAISRTFNSARLTPAGRHGAFGPGWNASFEVRLVTVSPKTIAARMTDGSPQYYFDDDLDGGFVSELPSSSESALETTAGGYRRTFRAGGEEVYDSSGRIVSVTDAAGTSTTYTRDAQGRLTSMTRLGRSIGISYSGASTLPFQLLGPSSAVLATYTYDASNRLETVTYPDGGGYRYEYDGGNRVLRVKDAGGDILETHTYDAQGRAITSEITQGVEGVAIAYSGNQTTVTDTLGRTTTYDIGSYHGVRRITKITGLCSSCGASGNTQEWTYDSLGRTLTYKDGATNLTTYTYNASGDLLTETDPLNQTTTYTYDAQGRLTATRPASGVTTLTHGPAGPLTTTDPLNRTTTITYNVLNKPDTITDPREKITTLTYDMTTGDLTSVADPLTHGTTFGYDAYGRRVTVTDALNNTTTTTYDSRGRVTRITSPDTTFTEMAYDADGHRISVTDPMGRITRYGYDVFGRLEGVVDPAGGVTRYEYDLMSNLVALSDAKSQTTTFAYDGFNRVTTVTYPGGAAETFTYDAAGRLSTKTDRKGVVTTYGYDAASRLLSKTYSDGVTPSVTYTYDAAGRLKTAANGSDSLTWTYDLAGQLLAEQSTLNSSAVEYTYDGAGNRLNVSLNGSVFVTYAYDDASRLTTITRGANVFSFGYDNANRRTSVSYPNGITTAYAYDTLSRLTSLGASLGATPVTSFTYTYDASGNRMTKTTLTETDTYGYDSLQRLIEVGSTGATPASTFYSYDPVGNRVTEQLDQVVRSSVFDARNQLLSTSGGGQLRIRGHLDEPGSATVNGLPARMLAGNVFDVTIPATTGANTVTVAATDLSGNVRNKSWTVTVPADSVSYSYDSNGNLTSKTEGSTTWTYEWNAENQLTRVLSNGSEVARYKYDPTGRRVERTAAGSVTTYAYDAIDVLREQVTTGAQTVTSLFLHGRGSDQPMLRESGGGAHYYHLDGSFSVVAETSDAGVVEGTYSYDAWGQPVGPSAAGFRYTSRNWDPETRLYYYRARYYDPSLGRFLSQDPVGMTDGPNLYAYVGGNPTSRRDPMGTTWQDFTNCTRSPLGVGVCMVTGLCYLEAEGLERRLTGGNSDNDRDNAVKHCFWACCIARQTNFKQAMLAVNAHEADDRNSTDPARACGSEMDRWNNRIGASIGANLDVMSWQQGNGTCEQQCIDSGALQCEARQAPASSCSGSAF